MAWVVGYSAAFFNQPAKMDSLQTNTLYQHTVQVSLTLISAHHLPMRYVTLSPLISAHHLPMRYVTLSPLISAHHLPMSEIRNTKS